MVTDDNFLFEINCRIRMVKFRVEIKNRRISQLLFDHTGKAMAMIREFNVHSLDKCFSDT